MKKKTYVLTLSKYFPKTHKRAGERTGFLDNILLSKLHTIRSNYDLWNERAEKINEGEAILSIRYWSGLPYKSKQVELLKLEKIGVEKLEEPDNFVFAKIEGKYFDWKTVAENDGLTFENFCEWFKKRQSEPMAILHFTSFRYVECNK
ncbi:hypothetical protein [Flammeovirga sp. OC4]|uniref:hypothetical protein n=1 Tax=Flammeovirga sp. OC4 TaxID=1382345 RepID=UPI0005C692FA|nr:hypothetical protein [Flammeovirga sp. OC4]